MKYLPTIDLWNPAFADAVRTGQLRLQTGQWVLCGGKKPSRFVRVTRKGGSIYVVHRHGDKKLSNRRFRDAVEKW